MTALDQHFENLSAARPGYTPWAGLIVKDGSAVYTIEPTDRPDLPGTHKVTGNHGSIYGYWAEVSGRSVRIARSGWYGQRGVLGTFDTRDTPNPGDDRPTMRVKGWVSINTGI